VSDATQFNYVRKVDFAAIEALGPDERFTQKLLDATTGAQHCTLSCIRTQVGGGSPEGMHIHEVDQVFYTLSGIMQIQIEDERFAVEPGCAIIFPAGVPHKNWNDGPEPTVHLTMSAPVPDPSKPFASPAPRTSD
jgi:mannose-6-phosphate isomerase-like protein (cupin superfamily)